MCGRHVVLKQLRLGHVCSTVSGGVCPILTLPGKLPDAFCRTHLEAEVGCILVSLFGWTQEWKALFSELSIHLTQPPWLNPSTHIPFWGSRQSFAGVIFHVPFPWDAHLVVLLWWSCCYSRGWAIAVWARKEPCAAHPGEVQPGHLALRTFQQIHHHALRLAVHSHLQIKSIFWSMTSFHI